MVDAVRRKALVLCSGGVDSTTLLAKAVEEYGARNVVALSISYGQKHLREIEAARAVAGHYGVEQRFLDLAAIFADSQCFRRGDSAGCLRRAAGAGGWLGREHVRPVPQRAVSFLGGVHGPFAGVFGRVLWRPPR